MALKHSFYLALGLILFFGFSYLTNISDDNHYTIHTNSGNIQCKYHNSRDLNNGWMVYYDYTTNKQEYIAYQKVDSITIHHENFWTCGPKDKNMLYIKLNK